MVYINYKKLKVNPDNPRFIDEADFRSLVKSIMEFPEMLEKRPIIAYTDVNGTWMIIGGNQRYEAAVEAGLKRIPVLLADDWNEAQRREFMIKDNLSAGKWDYDMLATNFDDLEQLAGWGLDIPNLAMDAGPSDETYFDDSGIVAKNQYGVIVLCLDEEIQQRVFNELTTVGHNCKIVVT